MLKEKIGLSLLLLGLLLPLKLASAQSGQPVIAVNLAPTTQPQLSQSAINISPMQHFLDVAGIENFGWVLGKQEVKRFYALRNYQSIWPAQPEKKLFVEQLLQSTEEAAAQGVKPAVQLAAKLKELKVDQPLSEQVALKQEAEITLLLLKTVKTLRQGELSFYDRPADWAIAPDQVDIVALAATAWQKQRPIQFFAEFMPRHPDYIRLIDGWKKIRKLDVHWPIMPEGEKLTKNMQHEQVKLLREILEKEAIFSGDDKVHLTDHPQPLLFDDAVEAALKKFQARHGLAMDGRVGAQTRKMLNIPAAERKQMVWINLARWRSMPHNWFSRGAETATRFLWVNIPEQRVYGVEADEDISFTSDVVVGSVKTPTPILNSAIANVLLNPPWFTPRSIASTEILGKLQKSPDYLQKNNMVIRNRPEDPYGQQVNWFDYSKGNFPFQIKQNPGDKSALGVYKFEFDNPFSIYLHDTPQKRGFDRALRAESHGCVRVEDPRGLALWLLAHDGNEWSEEKLTTLQEKKKTMRLATKESVPLYITYFTALVDKDGVLQYRQDIYQRDKSFPDLNISE
ncbi:MAG: L,D-transpeptidase family protein [Alphaproteobacteria bacterium]